jgi:hypothetical protein
MSVMMPIWFSVNRIPFDCVWQDAVHRFPRILKGELLRARFTFRDDNETVDELEVKAYV